jgi:delta(3,5)-delta(2,4)-dienoyl-CoA isomerase
MWLELKTVFDALSHNPDVRAIVLSGAGPRAFTTGLDVKHATNSPIMSANDALDPARQAQKARRHVYEFQESISAVEKCEKPVICVMHGHCLGLAIDLSACADVRICAADAKFAVKEVDIGIAADIGTLTRLPKVVGSYSWVKDVCLTARPFGAAEARDVGYVSAVYETKDKTVEAAVQWAVLAASKSPVAVQGTKEIINYSRDHTVDEGECFSFLDVRSGALLTTRQDCGIPPFGMLRCCRLRMCRSRCRRASRRRSLGLRSCSHVKRLERVFVASLDGPEIVVLIVVELLCRRRTAGYG